MKFNRMTPVLVGTLAMTVGCATTTPPPARMTTTVSLAVPESTVTEEHVEAVAPPAPAPAPPSIEDVVGSCARAPKAKACSIGSNDVAALCRSMTADRAVKTFAAATKLSRAFLTGDVDAWSTITGVRTSKTRALFDEEVLVLTEVRSRSGIVISGSAVVYEVLRWDGTCATLSGGELTFRRPPSPRRPVDFTKLDDATSTWLTADAALAKAENALEASCKSDGAGRSCTIARARRDAALGRFVLGR
ncbi:MAG TPA: hypothetical protein VIF62_12015 [Labilithrix sp.]